MLLDDLLTSYQEIETGFAEQLYQLYKSFEFRSLWNVNDRLTAFQRRASEAAKGTGKLQGVVELTKAMQELDKIESKGQDCFTRMHYSTDTHKWHFDNVKDKVVCEQMSQQINFVKKKLSARSPFLSALTLFFWLPYKFRVTT